MVGVYGGGTGDFGGRTWLAELCAALVEEGGRHGVCVNEENWDSISDQGAAARDIRRVSEFGRWQEIQSV